MLDLGQIMLYLILKENPLRDERDIHHFIYLFQQKFGYSSWFFGSYDGITVRSRTLGDDLRCLSEELNYNVVLQFMPEVKDFYCSIINFSIDNNIPFSCTLSLLTFFCFRCEKKSVKQVNEDYKLFLSEEFMNNISDFLKEEIYARQTV